MWRIGTIPYRSIRERSDIARRLKKEFGRVRINVYDDYIMYEYKEVTFN